MQFEILIIFNSRIAVPSNLGDLIEQDLLKSINVVLSGEPKNGEKSSRLEGRAVPPEGDKREIGAPSP